MDSPSAATVTAARDLISTLQAAIADDCLRRRGSDLPVLSADAVDGMVRDAAKLLRHLHREGEDTSGPMSDLLVAVEAMSDKIVSAHFMIWDDTHSRSDLSMGNCERCALPGTAAFYRSAHDTVEVRVGGQQ